MHHYKIIKKKKNLIKKSTLQENPKHKITPIIQNHPQNLTYQEKE